MFLEMDATLAVGFADGFDAEPVYEIIVVVTGLTTA